MLISLGSPGWPHRVVSWKSHEFIYAWHQVNHCKALNQQYTSRDGSASVLNKQTQVILFFFLIFNKHNKYLQRDKLFGSNWQNNHFPGSSDSTCNAGDMRGVGSIPGSGRSPREGNGNPLQRSCLENSTNRGTWRATVYRVTKSRTWLSAWAHVR